MTSSRFPTVRIALSATVLAAALAVPSRAAPVVDAKLGEGLTFKGDDGNFEAALRARGQFRVEAVAPEGDPAVAAILVRRLRATAKAKVLKGLFEFNLQLSFAPRDNEPELPSVVRDATATWNANRDFRLRVGQMKVPFDRQRIVSSSSLAFPERALAVSNLTLDRDVGVVWLSEDLAGLKLIEAQVGVFGGDGRTRMNSDLGLLTTARVEVSPLGQFDDMTEGSLSHDEPFHFAIATAVGFNKDSPRARSTTGAFDPNARADFLHGTVDVIAKGHGVSGLLEGLCRQATAVRGQATASSAAMALLQVGALVTDDLELVARVAHEEPLQGSWLIVPNPAGVHATTELRPGVNYYVHGHDAKLQAALGVVVLDDWTRTVDGQLQLQLWL